MALPFNGGRVRFPVGSEFVDTYPSGKAIWRCSACGKVGPWQVGWGGYWSMLDEDDGLYADHGNGYPVWCSGPCEATVVASGACTPLQTPTVTRKRGGR